MNMWFSWSNGFTMTTGLAVEQLEKLVSEQPDAKLISAVSMGANFGGT
jgi:hypothetical protein